MFRPSLIIVAATSLMACSNNNTTDPNNIRFDPDSTMANNTTPDATVPVDMPTPPDMGTPTDAGDEFDFAVEAAGFMHGDWTVTRVEGGGEIAVLRLRHEAGETRATGTYRMTEPPAFGLLGGSNWMVDEFTTSWTVAIDGTDQRFGLASCARDGGDDQLACRHSDPISGDVVDALMTRN